MKKIIKENWFKSILIVILLIVGLSVAYYFTIFLPVHQQQNNFSKQTNSTTVNSIDLQYKCASQAEKTLNTFEKESSELPFHSFSQKNHYNQKMDQCFVYISYKGPVYNGNSGSYWILKDAFENDNLAGCPYNLNEGNPFVKCFIKGGAYSLTQEEIDNFVNQSMELK